MANENSLKQFAAVAGETLANQLQEQERSEAEVRRQQDETYASVHTARDALMASFLGKHNKTKEAAEYPPEIIEIANVLMSQPRLIPTTQLFLKRTVLKINQVVNEVLSDTLGSEEESS